MIDRYSLPEMSVIWTDDAKIARWLEVELLATEAHAELGVVPAADAVQCRAKARVSAAEVEERERVTDHDVAAFVDLVQASIGFPAGGWIHYGLTSTDVVDTALCLALAESADLLITSATDLIQSLQRRSAEFANTPCMGRTHGIHAEPTTFGTKLALWALAVDRDRTRLRRAREAIAVGKLSGAVGTFSNIDPFVESYVCRRLVRTAMLAREVGLSTWVKVEVIGDQKTLFPDNEATLEATKILVKEGFTVLPYFSDDLIMAKKLIDAGAAAVMPLAAPIGSGLGIQNPNNLRIMREQITSVPIIVDAGVPKGKLIPDETTGASASAGKGGLCIQAITSG